MAIQKPTPELIQEISQSLSTGMLLADAAALAGIDRQTLAEWMQRAADGTEPYAAARKEFSKADLTAQKHLLVRLSVAARSDPKYAGWLLTRRWRKGWGDTAVEETPTVSADTIRNPADVKATAGRIRQRFPLLGWESPDEFEALVTRLLDEHQPQGPTEEYLVEELAGTLLRKGRLRLAETASHRHQLRRAVQYDSKDITRAAVAHLTSEKPEETLLAALTATNEQSAEELSGREADKAAVEKAIAHLESNRAERYAAALGALGERKEWWDEALSRAKSKDQEVGTIYKESADGLLSFLQEEVLPWCSRWILAVENRATIRQQAFGETFKLEDHETLGRIEATLDRKMDKILDRLFQLQERRRAKTG